MSAATVDEEYSTPEKEYSTENIDYLLKTYVGGSGRWQWGLMLCLFPVCFASGYPLLIHTLATYEPAHRLVSKIFIFF